MTNKYNDKIYQLDELISDIYNCVYDRSNDYERIYIDVMDLKLSRFKLYDYDLDIIFEKTPIIKASDFDTGLIYNNEHLKQICFKRQGVSHSSTIRIIEYPDIKTIENMNNPINVNQIIKTMMSELVVNDSSTNFLLPVINVDVKGSDLTSYSKITPYIDKDKYYSVQITEKFFSLTTLDKFLKDYNIDHHIIKSIIYQIVNTYYQISVPYPDFRYNQLFPEMIDCYVKYNNNIFYPEIKLSNYYLSEIKNIVDNNYLETEIKIPKINNIYSDLYQLLNYLWNNQQIHIQKNNELNKLFDDILPKKIRSSQKYLTLELWNKLDDDEKHSLRILNIKNNSSLTSKDSISNAKFQEIQENDLMGGISDDDIENSDWQSTYSNIKSPGNHIDMKHKHTKNISNDDDNTSELLKMSESRISQNKGARNKIKKYKGTRQLAGNHISNEELSRIIYPGDSYKSSDPAPQPYVNTLAQALGANPNDFAKHNQYMQQYTPMPSQSPQHLNSPMIPQMTPQIPQMSPQMTQIPQMPQMSQMSQMSQMPQMSQMSQMPSQFSNTGFDQSMVDRYHQITGSNGGLPLSQAQFNQALSQYQNSIPQTQVDPSLYQQGGANNGSRNPFFFQ